MAKNREGFLVALISAVFILFPAAVRADDSEKARQLAMQEGNRDPLACADVFQKDETFAIKDGKYSYTLSFSSEKAQRYVRVTNEFKSDGPEGGGKWDTTLNLSDQSYTHNSKYESGTQQHETSKLKDLKVEHEEFLTRMSEVKKGTNGNFQDAYEILVEKAQRQKGAEKAETLKLMQAILCYRSMQLYQEKLAQITLMKLKERKMVEERYGGIAEKDSKGVPETDTLGDGEGTPAQSRTAKTPGQ